MLIYRPHRGSLADAMAEAKIFNSFDEIKEYVTHQWNSVWGWNILNPNDDRISWKDVRYLCLKRLGNEDYMEEYGCPQCIGFVGWIE